MTCKVLSLTPPPAPGRPWTVELEGGQREKVPEGVVIDCALYAGKELTDQERETLTQAATGAKLREKAASLLTARMMSRGTLVSKLLDKGATQAQAQDIAQWAEDIGLLNDQEYAKALVRHYQAKGYGLYKIKDELYRRKVPRLYWEEALATMEPTEEAIRRFLAAKLHDPTDRKQVKKASDALVRRGFSWREVQEGMAAFLGEWEE